MDKAGLTDFDREMESRFHNAGAVVPSDRMAGTYADARHMITMLHWLRGQRSAAAEPSNVFRIVGGR